MLDTAPLIEREGPNATDATEIRHYIRIYWEMIAFKEELIARAHALLAGLSDEAQVTLTKTDIHLLEEQRARLRSRLDYWHHRLWEAEGIDLDPEAMTAGYKGVRIELTRREFELLRYLLSKPGEFLRPRQLLNAAWGDHRLSEEQLRTYVVRLRRKLLALGVPASIASNRRHGYSLRFEG